MSVADVNLREVKALPAAAATNYCDAIDLGADRVGAIGANLTAHLKVPALPALVEDKTVIFVFQDSANGTDFTTVFTLNQATITGGSGDGADAKETRFYLPPDTRRYVRVGATVLTAGGDNTGVSYTFELRV